ncbi:DUF3558 domain-containing protein [Streptomyces sp. NPDC058045]|uniref:DUF3558 domain-containing protein n=1 Tax=Streptomyces sp. NPDC058045 TaxID=3346311 RepID=UPI0036DFDDF3
MHRPVQRLTRVLACAAAVPVLLIASGCSSDSGSGSGDGGEKAKSPSSSASAAGAGESPSVEKARYAELPEACKTLSRKTLDSMVPEADPKSGKAGRSDDTSMRGTCSWSSLDNKGVDGSQFRWLNVSLLRFESDASRGNGAKLAGAYYAKQVADAKATEGAKDTRTGAVPGIGDQATAVRYDLKKKEGSFKQQTVVARVENIVVTVDYNGAGLAGEKTPDPKKLQKDAEKAAKEAVEAVVAANEGGGSATGSPDKSGKGEGSGKGDGAGKGAGEGSGSKSPEPKSPSKSADSGAKPTDAASASESPSESAAKS